jgi:hypothetical protein
MSQKKKSKVLPTAIMMAIGGAIGFGAAHYGMKAGRELPSEVVLLLAIAAIPVFFFGIKSRTGGSSNGTKM